jgi:hypothetical protein
VVVESPPDVKAKRYMNSVGGNMKINNEINNDISTGSTNVQLEGTYQRIPAGALASQKSPEHNLPYLRVYSR